jgi:GIY-YIG catalytic domain
MTAVEPTALYRFFAADGDLLYVGITKRPGPRFSSHFSTSRLSHYAAAEAQAVCTAVICSRVG